MEYDRLRSLQRLYRKRRIKTHINRSLLILLSRTTLYLSLLFILIIGIQAGVKLSIDYLRTTSFFALQRIDVIGVNRLTESDIINLASIAPNTNILTINLNDADKKIRQNPWIRSLRLRRILPGTLRITIQEKTAFAAVNYESPFFVTKEGEIIKKVSAGEEIDMPVISGLQANDPDSIKAALSILQSPETQKVIPLTQIGELHFDESRLTFFTISPTIKILADTRTLNPQLHRLKLVLNNLENRELIPRQIDLNYSKKVVVKLKKSQ